MRNGSVEEMKNLEAFVIVSSSSTIDHSVTPSFSFAETLYGCAPIFRAVRKQSSAMRAIASR